MAHIRRLKCIQCSVGAWKCLRSLPILDKIPAPMDARFLSSVGAGVWHPYREIHNSSQHPYWIKIDFPETWPENIPPLQNTNRHKNYFRMFFGALTTKAGKSPWGCCRDKFLPNYSRVASASPKSAPTSLGSRLERLQACKHGHINCRMCSEYQNPLATRKVSLIRNEVIVSVTS